MRRLVIATVAAFVLYSMALAGDVPKPASSAVQVTSTPFSEVVQTYATNEARAEALYQDKPVTVSGTLVRVVTNRYWRRDEGKREKDIYFAELHAEEFGPSDICVRFFFNKDELDELAKLRAGQEVIIQGRGQGPTIYTGDRRKKERDYLEVRFCDCKVIKAK
jgi:uncharacterized protein YdeI (BOF family)